MSPYTDPYLDWLRRQSPEYRKKDRERAKRYSKLHPTYRLERLHKRKEILREQIKRIFPQTCIICGGIDKRSKVGVSFHEIHGKKHPTENEAKYLYILSHIEDFVPVCNNCHVNMCNRIADFGIDFKVFLQFLRQNGVGKGVVNLKEGNGLIGSTFSDVREEATQPLKTPLTVGKQRRYSP